MKKLYSGYEVRKFLLDVKIRTVRTYCLDKQWKKRVINRLQNDLRTLRRSNDKKRD